MSQKHKELVSIDLLASLIRYEPETGKLFWVWRDVSCFEPKGSHSAAHRCAIWNAKYAGREALTANNGNTYKEGRIFNEKYYAHRVAWALHTQSWPDGHIDHINGNRADNRIDNLRDVTRSQNLHNRPAQTNNKSGFKGVSWSRRRGMWAAQICVHRKNHVLGFFNCTTAAQIAYQQASAKMVWGAN